MQACHWQASDRRVPLHRETWRRRTAIAELRGGLADESMARGSKMESLLSTHLPVAPTTSDAYFGGGLAPLVLKEWGANSTRTPFLHREGRFETGGCEFNTEERGGYSE